MIGLLLVFRTNTAYDRWWEGRKQWGAMVNNTRNMAMKLNAILPESAVAARQYFKIMIPNYVFAMKEHLREGVKAEELALVEGVDLRSMLAKDHVPNAIAGHMFAYLHQLYRAGQITGDQLITADKE